MEKIKEAFDILFGDIDFDSLIAAIVGGFIIMLVIGIVFGLLVLIGNRFGPTVALSGVAVWAVISFILYKSLKEK